MVATMAVVVAIQEAAVMVGELRAAEVKALAQKAAVKALEARVGRKAVEGWAVAARTVEAPTEVKEAVAEATAVVAVRCTLNSPSIQRKKST